MQTVGPGSDTANPRLILDEIAKVAFFLKVNSLAYLPENVNGVSEKNQINMSDTFTGKRAGFFQPDTSAQADNEEENKKVEGRQETPSTSKTF